MKLTKAQQQAVLLKYHTDPNGAASYLAFRRRVEPMMYCGGTAVLPWCGMWLAIETDGYTHS